MSLQMCAAFLRFWEKGKMGVKEGKTGKRGRTVTLADPVDGVL